MVKIDISSFQPLPAKEFTQRLWKQATPTGKWRYYDGLLHMFSVLQMSGEYKIYGPTDALSK